jgi:hypothetical protein
MTPEQLSDSTNRLASGIAQVREYLAPIDEAALGYRRQLEQAGWSPTAAEKMALAFHAMLLSFMGR